MTATTTMNPAQLITARQAAKILCISEKTLYTLTKRGDVKAVRIGRSVRYAQGELECYIDRQTTCASS